jgi:hypothetical protein
MRHGPLSVTLLQSAATLEGNNVHCHRNIAASESARE